MGSGRGSVAAIIIAVILAAAAVGVRGQVEAAPGQALDCTGSLVNMSDCLSYVEKGSDVTRPEKGCCPAVAGVLDSQPICICQLLSNANSFGVDISVQRVLLLPSLCGLKAPSLSISSLLNMSDCLSYLKKGSNVTRPENGCCPAVAGLLDSIPICICPLLSNANSFGDEISVQRALLLPSLCGLKAPLLSRCSAAGHPIVLPPSPALTFVLLCSAPL